MLLASLKRLFSRASDQPQDVRSLGLLAWLGRSYILRNDKALAKFLSRLPEADRPVIEQDIRAAFSAADAYLFASAGDGPLDMKAFNADLRAHMAKDFPWLSDKALRPIEMYCQWMAWHDGL